MQKTALANPTHFADASPPEAGEEDAGAPPPEADEDDTPFFWSIGHGYGRHLLWWRGCARMRALVHAASET